MTEGHDEKMKFFKTGNYQFKWDCEIDDDNKTFQILATELVSKDQFKTEFTFEELMQMKWFKNDPQEIKYFIERVLFEKDENMEFEIDFVDNQIDSNQSNNSTNQFTNQSTSQYTLTHNKDYTHESDIEIIIRYENEYIRKKWKMNLQYLPKDKDTYQMMKMVRDLKKENDKLKDQITNIIPKGSIIMWSGTVQNIPDGWNLCDGSKNTPDLTDRFVVGAGRQYGIGDKGGSKSHSHDVSVSSHRLTTKQIPTHYHTIKKKYVEIHSGKTGPVYTVLCADSADNDRYQSHVLTSDHVGSSKAHSHEASCSKSDNIPPYIAVGFIMKI